MGERAQAEALFRQFKAKKEVLVGKSKESVAATYGSAAQPADEAALLLGQTEAYVEYDARGRLLRGDARTARSRYEEDVHPGNHTSVRPRAGPRCVLLFRPTARFPYSSSARVLLVLLCC